MPSTEVTTTFDLPIRLELSRERQSSIEQALRRYRNRVLEDNINVLNALVEAVGDDDPPRQQCPPYGKRDGPLEKRPKRQLDWLAEDHGICLMPEDPSVKTVADLLSEDRRQTLVQSCQLDGTRCGEVDLAARNALFDDVESKIATSGNVRARPEGFPADLKYLLTLVRGICGPGLPDYRLLQQLEFLSDDDDEEDEGVGACGWVAVPATREEIGRGEIGEIIDVWEDSEKGDYEVSLAVCLGRNGFAVYCRPMEISDSHGEIHGGWSWKYSLLDLKATNFDLYDTVEDFLEFYADFNKQSM